MASLSRLERAVCGPLIRRQLDRNPRADREISKYGPVGEVRLCSARAIQVYTYPVIFIGIGLALAGATVASGIAVLVVFVVAIIAISRLASASVAGRRWRRSRSASLTGEPPVGMHP